MKLFWICAAILLSLVSVSMVFKYGQADLSALVWHMRHGSHVEIGGVKVPVPLSYEANDPGGLPSLSLMRLPGFRGRGAGFIDIDFTAIPSPEAQAALRALVPQGRTSLKETKIADRAVAFAGRHGACSEYHVELVDPDLGIQTFEVYCHFEGNLSATFTGSPTLKDEFYKIIQTAEPIGAKE